MGFRDFSEAIKSKSIKEILMWIVVFAIIFSFFSIILFFMSPVDDADRLNKLIVIGNYFGGVLGPAFSFCALIGLLFTVYHNHQELIYTREEMRKSSEALTQSKLIFEREEKRENKKERKEDLFRMINLKHNEIKDILKSNVASISSSGSLMSALIHADEGALSIPKHAIDYNSHIFSQLSINFERLRICLTEYEDLSVNILTEYFKAYHRKTVVLMRNVLGDRFLHNDDYEYFSNASVTLNVTVPPPF